MSDISLKHKIALSLIPGVGDINAKKLVAHIGSVEGVFREPYGSLLKIPGIGTTLAKYICERSYLEKAEEEAAWVSGNNIRTFFYLDDDYPYRLKQCEDAPVTFYYKGSSDLNSPKLLSVVGTRNATARGREHCDRIITQLSHDFPDLIIVSGLAYGIDIAAHKSAISNNLQTIGVLGHGFRTIYPSVHENVAREMIKKGGLLSDFLSGDLPERNNFIKRNRIIAGISDATLVVESGTKGGALITADIACSYNRDVFAIPGRPDDQWSAGCNTLIKRNKAALVENASDIEYLLGWNTPGTSMPVQRVLFNDLSAEEKGVFEYISREGEMNIDQLCRITGIPVFRLSAILLKLEFDGIIRCLPGNIYRLVL